MSEAKKRYERIMENFEEYYDLINRWKDALICCDYTLVKELGKKIRDIEEDS